MINYYIFRRKEKKRENRKNHKKERNVWTCARAQATSPDASLAAHLSLLYNIIIHRWYTHEHDYYYYYY